MPECPSCGKDRPENLMHSAGTIPPMIVDHIHAKKPDWSPEKPVCEKCINEAIAEEAEEMLTVLQKSDLTPLERDVIESLRRGSMMAQNVAEMDDEIHLSQTDKIADRVVNIVGSFAFSASLLLIVIVWVLYGYSTGMLERNPALMFGGLGGFLGTLAAIQNPIILMAQRRQARRDRYRAENDYRVNLKSELEVRYINAKLDYMMENIRATRAEYQQQIEAQK